MIHVIAIVNSRILIIMTRYPIFNFVMISDSTSKDGRAPGADDDASGSCTVLEVRQSISLLIIVQLFRVLAASDFKPSRSIEFHTYSAEEAGLRGSQDIAVAYQNNQVPVYAMMQLDMMWYVKPDTTPQIGLYDDNVNPDLCDVDRNIL